MSTIIIIKKTDVKKYGNNYQFLNKMNLGKKINLYIFDNKTTLHKCTKNEFAKNWVNEKWKDNIFCEVTSNEFLEAIEFDFRILIRD